MEVDVHRDPDGLVAEALLDNLAVDAAIGSQAACLGRSEWKWITGICWWTGWVLRNRASCWWKVRENTRSSARAFLIPDDDHVGITSLMARSRAR
jgi:hypothetical protein